MEITRPREVPRELAPLFDSETEEGVIQEAKKLISSSSGENQQSLLRDPFFLSIVFEALRGMDEQRKGSVIEITESFDKTHRVEAFTKFSRLLRNSSLWPQG